MEQCSPGPWCDIAKMTDSSVHNQLHVVHELRETNWQCIIDNTMNKCNKVERTINTTQDSDVVGGVW